MELIVPDPLDFTEAPFIYGVRVEGELPKGGGKHPVTWDSLWVYQEVYDSNDLPVDLAQYVKVQSDHRAWMMLAETPSWQDIPGGGGRIELKLVSKNGYRRDITVATKTITLLP